jgi:hypothetical protein
MVLYLVRGVFIRLSDKNIFVAMKLTKKSKFYFEI